MDKFLKAVGGAALIGLMVGVFCACVYAPILIVAKALH